MNLEESILRMLSSENPQKRLFALESIQSNKVNSPAIIEALEKATHDPNLDVSGYAQDILHHLVGSKEISQGERADSESDSATDSPSSRVANNISGIQSINTRAVEANPNSIDTQSDNGAPLPTNPTELLQEQVRLLRRITTNLENLRTSQKQAEDKLSILQETGSSLLNSRGVPRMVNVSDVNMQLDSMIFFMIKWAIASIPAGIILGIVTIIILSVFGGILKGMLGL
jgi:hypothetical protein